MGVDKRLLGEIGEILRRAEDEAAELSCDQIADSVFSLHKDDIDWLRRQSWKSIRRAVNDFTRHTRACEATPGQLSFSAKGLEETKLYYIVKRNGKSAPIRVDRLTREEFEAVRNRMRKQRNGLEKHVGELYTVERLVHGDASAKAA